jgi:hypothetical protein
MIQSQMPSGLWTKRIGLSLSERLEGVQVAAQSVGRK